MDWTAFNRNFYDSFAGEFSRSREALNPGILRALESLDLSSVLDVGCGDGRLIKALPAGCHYLGLDFSPKLIGRAGPGHAAGRPLWVLADVSRPLPVASQSFPAVVCFAVLHHLTGRVGLVRELGRVLRPEGRIVLSVWQITHNARMRKKIVRDLGNGDYVLGWERGGHGERFVHQVNEDELGDLVRQAGLEIVDLYRSDGKSGDLGLYSVLRPARRPSLP
jgi:SAM-dependent methyltransferase